jgi:hypothetical protein
MGPDQLFIPELMPGAGEKMSGKIETEPTTNELTSIARRQWNLLCSNGI